MPNSQNGWPVIPDSTAGRAKLAELVLPGTMPHPVRVLAGDVATVARWHVREYHRRVEPIKPPGCWGWNVRKIGDGPDWSNHASATAWDLNAPDNPDGAPPSDVLTAEQIAECHALERESDGVLRWGGDWSDPDPMHWEIIKGSSAVAALAARIEEEDMPTAKEVVDELLGRKLEFKHYDPANPLRTVADLLRYIPSLNLITSGVDAKLAPRFAALAAKDVVDEQALAAALAPAIAAALPPDQPVTDEQLVAALVAALRELAAGPTA
jgi:hypothetical protein